MSLGFAINPWGKNGMGWMMIDDMEKHVIQEWFYQFFQQKNAMQGLECHFRQ